MRASRRMLSIAVFFVLLANIVVLPAMAQTEENKPETLGDLLNYIKDQLLDKILPPLAGLMYVILAIKVKLSGGNPEEIAKAKRWGVYIAIALLVAYGAQIIVNTLRALAGYGG